jgi:cytidine deaminase
VFGLVGAVGTNFDPVVKSIQNSLGDVGYSHCEVIRLSRLLNEFDVWDGVPSNDGLPEDERLDRYMTAGNRLRESTQRGDALVGAAVEAIWSFRETKGRASDGGPPEGLDNHAYILNSLKHPDEVRRLQTIYGPGFVLVGVYLPEEVLAESLSKRIADSRHTQNAEQFRERAQQLITRDSFEPETRFGQNVRNTFVMADLFVDASDERKLSHAIGRFVELMFGHPNYTPTRDEAGMYYAYSSALLSASLNRQVGASITTGDGQLVATGVNEVPKPGGGFYWEGMEASEDDRDFRRGADSNEMIQNEILDDLLKKLEKNGWLLKTEIPTDIHEVRTKLAGTRVLDVIEFHRAVHAETAALLDAAQRGVSIQNCTLYCTTFPCHNCAGHIIAAGIRRVVYIEPYPKSKARDFYEKAFTTDPKQENRVWLAPFVGVGPRRYRDLFSTTTGDGKKIERANDRGEAVKPEAREKRLKIGTLSTSQFDNEAGFIESLRETLRAKRSHKEVANE